ncbi:MAG: ParA family protein [Betaproteobacteria bacterium]|nr:ParA family protein [Betaproteobacteria bacterium]
MKAWIFVVVNQKGGVGKTTTSVNTATALARAGKRVLLVDLDPQGNATMGYYALEGLSDLVNTIRKVQTNFNPDLSMLGLLRVMFDARITLAQQVSDQLAEHFDEKVFKTVIPRNVRLAEAPSHGMPGLVFDPSSRGAKAYASFGDELLARLAAA